MSSCRPRLANLKIASSCYRRTQRRSIGDEASGPSGIDGLAISEVGATVGDLCFDFLLLLLLGVGVFEEDAEVEEESGEDQAVVFGSVST
ncbi:hypothetical protein COP2_007621 [Malus domestica]